MNFFALSQAPPALDMKIAIMTPAIERAGEEATERLDADAALADDERDGDGHRMPGTIICLSEPAVEISTQRAASGFAVPSRMPGISLN